PGRVGVREERPDVAEPRGTQERVGDRMGDHVAVAVTPQGPFALEDHPTEDERTVRLVDERMHVETLSDPDGGEPRCAHDRTAIASITVRSSASVTFRFQRSPRT